MSQSSLQVLLHAGELEYIIRTIEKSPQNSKFVAGCLFGLWRNSLKQPVIQFVTGPGKGLKDCKIITRMLQNQYIDDCAQIIKADHCLLHLGFWFCGSPDDQRTAEKEVFKHGSKHNVLLFINLTRDSLTGEYLLKKDNVEETSELFKEDVLDGHSSFRLYEPLTNKIKGAMVSPGPTNQDVGRDISNLVQNLPSRVQVEVAVTNEAQWYSTDEGMERLQLLFQYFSSEGIQAGMSRDAITHNIQFDLSDGYCLDFPANFPKKMPLLRAADGECKTFKRGPASGEDVCKFVVDTVVAQLQKLRERGGRGGGYR